MNLVADTYTLLGIAVLGLPTALSLAFLGIEWLTRRQKRGRT